MSDWDGEVTEDYHSTYTPVLHKFKSHHPAKEGYIILTKGQQLTIRNKINENIRQYVK